MMPQYIKPTFEKYLSKNVGYPWLFDFQDRLSTSDSFNANVNAGISQICKKVSPDFHASLYSFRHSWATIAQNGCGASLGDVDFALNHSTYKMARVYHYDGFDISYYIDNAFRPYFVITNNTNKSLIIDKSKSYVLYNGYATQLFKDVRSSRSTTFNNVQDAINNVQTNEAGVSMTVPI